MEKVDISVVIPAYNEEKRIIPTLEKVYEYFIKRNEKFEIVVVDDGSKDNTVASIKSFAEKCKCTGIRIIQHAKNKGKGAAVRTGVLNTTGDLILFSDADLSTPVEEFEKLAAIITEEKYDIAIGSRSMKGSMIVVPQPFYRRLIGKMFPYLVRLIVLKNFKDTQCGFKLFTKQAGKILFTELKTEGFAFDVEILYRAVKKNYKVKEMPVMWINSNVSRVNLLRDPYLMFTDLLFIRRNVL